MIFFGYRNLLRMKREEEKKLETGVTPINLNDLASTFVKRGKRNVFPVLTSSLRLQYPGGKIAFWKSDR